MNLHDQIAKVIEIASLTEDRDPGEQRALIAVALHTDLARGRFTSTNYTGNRVPLPPTLVARVRDTYDPSSNEEIDLTHEQARSYSRLHARWVRCPCGIPRGALGPDHECTE